MHSHDKLGPNGQLQTSSVSQEDLDRFRASATIHDDESFVLILDSLLQEKIDAQESLLRAQLNEADTSQAK